MRNRKSSYIHPYPHLKYNIQDALEQYDCLRHYYLVVDDNGPAPTMRYVIWQMKHKYLMPFIKGEYYQIFHRYMCTCPRNYRKKLPADYRKLIKLIKDNWEKDYQIDQLDKELKELQNQLKQ